MEYQWGKAIGLKQRKDWYNWKLKKRNTESGRFVEVKKEKVHWTIHRTVHPRYEVGLGADTEWVSRGEILDDRKPGIDKKVIVLVRTGWIGTIIGEDVFNFFVLPQIDVPNFQQLREKKDRDSKRKLKELKGNGQWIQKTSVAMSFEGQRVRVTEKRAAVVNTGGGMVEEVKDDTPYYRVLPFESDWFGGLRELRFPEGSYECRAGTFANLEDLQVLIFRGTVNFQAGCFVNCPNLQFVYVSGACTLSTQCVSGGQEVVFFVCGQTWADGPVKYDNHPNLREYVEYGGGLRVCTPRVTPPEGERIKTAVQYLHQPVSASRGQPQDARGAHLLAAIKRKKRESIEVLRTKVAFHFGQEDKEYDLWRLWYLGTGGPAGEPFTEEEQKKRSKRRKKRRKKRPKTEGAGGNSFVRLRF